MALEFTINLTGNFTPALEKSSKALGDATKKTRDAEKAMEAFEVELGKVSAGALGINFSAISDGGGIFRFDLAQGAQIAYEAIRRVAEAVVDLGEELIKAAADAEDLNLAISLDVGDEGAAKVNELAESFGNSAFSPKQIKEALLPILEESGNTHSDQWNDLATAATDVATRRNTGVQGAKAALEALNNIELNPQRLRGSLKELGIKQLDYYKDLGDLLGVSEKAAEKQVKAGQVKAETLLNIALNQIQKREGGALGIATNEGAETFGASLKRLQELKTTLFSREAGAPGIKALQAALDKIVDTINGPVGDKAVKAFDHLLGAIGSFGTGHADAAFEKITAALDFVSTAIEGNNETWNRWVRNFDTVIDILGLALEPFLLIQRALVFVEGTIIEVGLALDGFLLDVGSALNEAIHGNFEKAFEIGTAIWQGIRDGIVGGVTHVYDAISDLGQGAVDAVKKKLHISSPSKVFAQLGAHTAEGYAQGIEQGGDRVAASSGSLGDSAIGGIGSPSFGGGAQITYAPVIYAGNAKEAEEILGRDRANFRRILEEVGVGVGA